jgi:hypothetical protein
LSATGGAYIGQETVVSEQERRRKLVPVSAPMLYALFTQGNTIHAECIQGLPRDARYIMSAYDAMRDTYYLCFESEQWAPVPDGTDLPIFNVIYRSIEVPYGSN